MAHQRPSPAARDRKEVATYSQQTESRPGTIGHALARYREARSWSRDELANWLGVTLDGLAGVLVADTPREEIITRDGVRNTHDPVVARRWLPSLAGCYGADVHRLAEALKVRIDG